MRLWSRGLGRQVLPLELGGARLDLTPERVVLSGVIREGKVVWDYTLKLTEVDFLDFSGLATHPRVLEFLARQHGVRLLRTIATGTARFLVGLLRAAVGRGVAIVPEDALEVGPGVEQKKERREHGVLVQGPR